MSMLLVSFTVALLVNHNASPRMLIAGALMVGNWTVLLKLSDYAPLALYHLWSVSVEEQFYLFFPFAAKYLSRRWMQAGCIAIIVVGLASLHFRAGESAGQIWKDSIPNFIFFAAGVLVALQFPAGKMPDLATGWRALLGALGCITIFLTEGLPILASTPAGRSGSVLIATYAMRMIGMVCILIAILGIRCYIPRVLVYLGQISFGLYMFHVWAIALATKLMGSSHVDGMPITFPRDGLALTLTILMAMASFHLLELPFLKLKDRFAIIRSRPTTVNATEVSVS
jgi:peptidoglycan/LPS O-acetylase OafA/YrhL